MIMRLSIFGLFDLLTKNPRKIYRGTLEDCHRYHHQQQLQRPERQTPKQDYCLTLPPGGFDEPL